MFPPCYLPNCQSPPRGYDVQPNLARALLHAARAARTEASGIGLFWGSHNRCGVLLSPVRIPDVHTSIMATGACRIRDDYDGLIGFRSQPTVSHRSFLPLLLLLLLLFLLLLLPLLLFLFVSPLRFTPDRLVGLVGKASVSRVADLGSIPAFGLDFFSWV